MKKTLLLSVLFCFSAASAYSQTPDYHVQRISNDRILLQGEMTEPEWSSASVMILTPFQFPWWTSGTKEQTSVRMLWDDNFLYVGVTATDAYIWAQHFNSFDDSLRLDDSFGIYLKPVAGPDSITYYFELSAIAIARAVLADGDSLVKVIPPRAGRRITGTVNNEPSLDTNWVLEIAIRFSDYPELFDGTPEHNDLIKVHLNRSGGQTNPQFSLWKYNSEAPDPDFTRPEDYGIIRFRDPEQSITEESSGTPVELSLKGVWPNPFNPETTIEFYIPSKGLVELDIYDTTGRKVRSLVTSVLEPGIHKIVWDGRNNDGMRVASGIYITSLKSSGVRVTGRMALIK